MRRLAAVVVLVGVLGSNASARVAYEEQSAATRVLLNIAAGVANVTPIVPMIWADKCLPGYVFCKLTFAAVSVLAAGEQVLFSGAGDMKQATSLLRRGFGGDWFMTGRHINGDVAPAVWTDTARPAPVTP